MPFIIDVIANAMQWNVVVDQVYHFVVLKFHVTIIEDSDTVLNLSRFEKS